jgi:hypothetical protein
MPATLQYRPTLIDSLITRPRMSSYQSVFRPTNDIELMGAYLWNAHVSGAIYPLIGLAEVFLRNAVDQALTAELGNFWWAGSRLRYRSFVPGAVVPRVVCAVRENFAVANQKYISEQRRRYRVRGRVMNNHHGVIAKTELSTWQFLLDSEFMGRGLIWPKCLGKVFAGPWPDTRASHVLSFAYDLVATIRDFRNRLFHHEPAWKRFGVFTEAEAIQHLLEKISKIRDLLELIHPENVRLLQKNGLLRTAYRACSSAEIRRFQHLAQTHAVNTLGDLALLVCRSAADNSVLHARLDGHAQEHFVVSSH